MNSIAAAVEAIKSGDIDRLAQLLADDNSLRNARAENGISLVMLACYHRRPDMAETLLHGRRGLDAFEAAALGRAGKLEELCRGDPELANAWSPDGFQPLHLAAFFAHPDCVELLLELHADTRVPARNPSAVGPIHSAVAGRDRRVVELLVERGAELNVKQHGGWTPLHAVAMHGDAELVRYFLEKGADPQLASDDGKTAADLAESNNHPEIAALLRKAN